MGSSSAARLEEDLEHGPLGSPGAPRRLAPFAAAAAVAILTLLIPPQPPFGAEIILAAALAVAVVAAAFLLPWRRWPIWTQAIAPIAFFLPLALMRDASGGAVSGLSPLAALPVIWLALYGTRREMAVSIGVLAITFLAPLVVIGSPDYPFGEWRRGVMWTLISGAIGFAIQGLTAQLRERRASAVAFAKTLRTVTEAVRQTDSRFARRELCAAATECSDASFAVLMEPAGAELVMTGTSEPRIPPLRIALGSETSGAAHAFATGERLFVSEAAGSPMVSQRLVALLGPASILFEPVRRGGSVIGVLAVAWDKPVSLVEDRVGLAVSLLAAEVASVLERGDLLTQLEELARNDALTGLPNRREWDAVSSLEIERAARAGHALTIAMIDIDRFKQLNDDLGHDAGDLALKAAARAWRSSLRTVDFLARYGGEEFAVALPACDLDEASEVLERLRVSTPGSITCSIGCARWDGYESAAELVKRADKALYRAKQRGRDRVEVAVEA